MTITQKAEELRRKAARADYLAQIYDEVLDRQKWNSMECHEPDEEHDEHWFTPYEPEDDDSYAAVMRQKYEAYCEVLDAIEKLVK